MCRCAATSERSKLASVRSSQTPRNTPAGRSLRRGRLLLVRIPFPAAAQDRKTEPGERNAGLALDGDKPAAEAAPPEPGRIDDLDEKVALLDKIAGATRANWERIKTFEGSGTYAASSA